MAEKVAIKFDEDALTLGDLEDFEDITGVPLFEALKPVNVKDEEGNLVRDDKGRPEQAVNMTAKTLKALVYIVLRNEPGREDFSLDDARKVKVTALEFVERAEPDAEGNGEGEADDETDPAPVG